MCGQPKDALAVRLRKQWDGRPRFAKLSIDDAVKVKIAYVHSDFVCGVSRCP